MNIACRMDNIDDRLMELMGEIGAIGELEIDDGLGDNTRRMIAYDYKILLAEIGIYAREGMMMGYDDAEREWYPAFSITLIFDGDDTILYWEQGSIKASFNNFFRSISEDDTAERLKNMTCVIDIGEKYIASKRKGDDGNA